MEHQQRQQLKKFFTRNAPMAYHRCLELTGSPEAALELVENGMCALVQRCADYPVSEWPTLFEQLQAKEIDDWQRYRRLQRLLPLRHPPPGGLLPEERLGRAIGRALRCTEEPSQTANRLWTSAYWHSLYPTGIALLLLLFLLWLLGYVL